MALSITINADVCSQAIAWGFTTDGFSGGEYSVVEDSFQKVNDDSTKLYNTGAVVQRCVLWQVREGLSYYQKKKTPKYKNKVDAHPLVSQVSFDSSDFLVTEHCQRRVVDGANTSLC